MLHNAPFGAISKRAGWNLVHDAKSILIYFHSFYHGPHNVAALAPIGAAQALCNLFDELVEMIQDLARFLILTGAFPKRLLLSFELGQAFFETADARLEIGPLHQPFAVGIQQP